MKKKTCMLKIVLLSLMFCFMLCGADRSCRAGDASSPTSPVKLIFIHHSCGENWLADDNGGLGIALRDNNYYVSDTYYGWGPDDRGDFTDIGYWYNWFNGPSSSTYLSALYNEWGQNSESHYSRLATDPGGENSIIMFKSCFPNSDLGGNPADPPVSGNNPLRDQDAWSEYMTVGNAKGIYTDLLTYFATRQDKLFVVITAPPLSVSETTPASAANARALNNWLINEWLADYYYNNVAVFDFYNVLTSNGGNSETNDAGSLTGNHHRWQNGTPEHVQTVASNTSAYPTSSDDSHPTKAGNLKATAEFLPMLNWFYNQWQESGSSPYAPPVLDIKANGSNKKISISTGSNLSVNISFMPGSQAEKPADWWILATTPFGLYSYDMNKMSWIPGFEVSYRAGIVEMASKSILDISVLPAGNYTFYFGVDLAMNGVIDGESLVYNYVEVEILP